MAAFTNPPQHIPLTPPSKQEANRFIEDNELIQSMEATFELCLKMARQKNSDYVGGADPFANFDRSEIVGVDPLRGVLVRMMDKISRAASLIDADPQVKDEALLDTLYDLTNYPPIMIAMLEREK